MTELSKILHVEDEEDIREVALLALELIGGFEVEQAELGSVALEKIGGFAPEMILIDVQMPGMSGPETLVEIRKIPGYETIPAIYMTAKITESQKGTLMGEHEIGVIPKPFDPTTLAEQIKTIWSEKG